MLLLLLCSTLSKDEPVQWDVNVIHRCWVDLHRCYNGAGWSVIRVVASVNRSSFSLAVIIVDHSLVRVMQALTKLVALLICDGLQGRLRR